MADYTALIAETESTYGLPPGMLKQLLKTESGFDPHAVNRASGALGIAQALPSTAKDPGYGIAPFDPTDAAASIDFAGHYLSVLRRQTGSWENALRHYGSLASKVGQSYNAQPQNANQALLLSLARHGDQGPVEQVHPIDPTPKLPNTVKPPEAVAPLGQTAAFEQQADNADLWNQIRGARGYQAPRGPVDNFPAPLDYAGIEADPGIGQGSLAMLPGNSPLNSFIPPGAAVAPTRPDRWSRTVAAMLGAR